MNDDSTLELFPAVQVLALATDDETSHPDRVKARGEELIYCTPRSEIDSYTYTARAHNPRCRHWAKVVRREQRLEVLYALPGITSAYDIGNAEGFAAKGETELFPGDWVFEGEANHPSKSRGWTYSLRRVQYQEAEGDALTLATYDTSSDVKARVKDLVKAGALPDPVGRALLRGAGDIAAMCRAYAAALEMIK